MLAAAGPSTATAEVGVRRRLNSGGTARRGDSDSPGEPGDVVPLQEGASGSSAAFAGWNSGDSNADIGVDGFQEISLQDGSTLKGLEMEETGIDVMETKQGLNTWRLAALTFFTVSGGPYGLEPLVATIGPFYSIIGLLLVPWVWGMPVALMTAELASTLPEMGGYIVWVQRTMGDFWAFQNGMWNIFTNCLDNALYPVMFVDYVEDVMGPEFEFSHTTRFLMGASMVGLLAVVNVVGVDVVGDGAGVFGIFVIAPFFLMVIVGFSSGEVEPSNWGDTITKPNLGLYISMLLWNTCGYDSAGTCAAEVENPGKIYPRAMLITVILTTLLYLGPIMVGVSFATDYSKWDDGYFVTVGELIGGNWLKYFVLIAGCVSALGLLNSTMCTSSRALACIASYGYAPKRLAVIHPKYGTPIYAIAVNASAITAMIATGLDFEAIAQLSMWLYALTLIFEILALLLLRVQEPHLERPYKIPLEMKGLYAMCALPTICCVALMVLSEALTWIVCGCILILSSALLVPYYRFSGNPVNLPRPVAQFLWLCRCYGFSRVKTSDHKGSLVDGDLENEEEDGDAGIEMPSRRVPSDDIDLEPIQLS